MLCEEAKHKRKYKKAVKDTTFDCLRVTLANN